MKPIVMLAAALLTLPFSAAAHAASGDIAGEYYCSDIRTYLNGEEIESINIGGKTLINAEIMEKYSFSVIWVDDARELWITSVPNAVNGEVPDVTHSDGTQGEPIGDYYETDIVTYLDGTPITAYNTGGKTYILAEEMRDFGYDVVWDDTDRTLSVTSPDRVGNYYNITLSQYVYHDISEEGSGRFCLNWSDGKSIGNGEADLCRIVFSRIKNKYDILMQYYQNEGLFMQQVSDVLIPLASSGRNGSCDPAEKYDEINEHIKISVNGESPQKIAVLYGGGNGHTDFELSFDDITLFKEDEIKEIKFSVDGDDTDEWYDIPIRKVFDAADFVESSFKENENDFAEYMYAVGDYSAVAFYESPRLGRIISHLYLVNESDHSLSDDLLKTVREYDGFDTEHIRLGSFTADNRGTNLTFSCTTDDVSADFSVDVSTGTVSRID